MGAGRYLRYAEKPNNVYIDIEGYELIILGMSWETYNSEYPESRDFLDNMFVMSTPPVSDDKPPGDGKLMNPPPAEPDHLKKRREE